MQVLEGHGHKVAYPILENELIEFIKREEKGTIMTSIIIKKAKSLSETIDIRGMKFSCGWAEQFKK